MDSYAVTSRVPVSIYLMDGCCSEATRAELAAAALDGLCQSVLPTNGPLMRSVSEEMRKTCRLLRELTDRSQVHMERVPTVLNYLNVLLGCLSRSTVDITKFCNDKGLSRETRWRTMYHVMSKEGGIPLPQRFVMYNHFLGLLIQLVTRSPLFDLNALDAIQERILKLREERGIPRPTGQLGPAITQQALMETGPHDRSDHWATEIFSRPLPSRTALTKRQPMSVTHGPYALPGQKMRIPPGAKILFRSLFDNETISVSVYLDAVDKSPYMLVSHHQHGQSQHSLRALHTLCIRRSGGGLVLKRLSETRGMGVAWLALAFITWEEMVLFHCTFLALKSNSLRLVALDPKEYLMKGEVQLFQARIIDDNFNHSLIVFRHSDTGGLRLHASSWEGELRECPIWTAFVTHQSQSPTWLEAKGRKVVLLKDIQLYVFSQDYRPDRMRKNKHGAFEIRFNKPEAAANFMELFGVQPPPPPPPRSNPSVMQPAEINEPSEPPGPESE